MDGSLLYDCPYSGKSYVLVVQNAIHVPHVDNNCILSFMMREAGIMVNEKANIHADDPKDTDHSITFNSTGFGILLYLWGIFSYFSTRCPMKEDLLKNSSSLSSGSPAVQRSSTLSWLSWYLLLKIASLHVSFTAYENFYKLSQTYCLFTWFSTFQPSEVSENRDPTMKHISTYTLISSSISTYVIDLFLVILFT